MEENLALSDLARRLEQSKEREFAEVKRIEEEKLSELSQRLSEQLNSGITIIERDIANQLQRIKASSKETIKQIEEMNKQAISVQSQMLEQMKEQASEIAKTSYAWVWVIIAALWTIIVATGAIYITKNPQALKSGITAEEATEYLQKKYEVVPLDGGNWKLLKKEK